MNIVANLTNKEIDHKKESLKKFEDMRRKMRQNMAGMNGDEESKSEIDDLKAKLDKLELPEETKLICDREVRKLKQLGPRNQEYHVSMNYL